MGFWIMSKDDHRYPAPFESPEMPAGLFDKIILAIRREHELRHTRKLAYGFITLLFISFSAAPFSWAFFSKEITQSGTLYFISTALADFKIFLNLWQDFGLAIIESLPVAGLTILILNTILAVFTIRLFLYRKRVLINYLLHRTV